MQDKRIISIKQIVWMLFIIITSFSVVGIPSLLLNISGRESWLAVVGGWLLDVILAVLYAYMTIRFEGQNFVQYSITILGKYFGRIVGIIFPVFFLLVSILLAKNFIQIISVIFLPKTPPQLILVLAFLIIGYTARKGIETIGRVSQILGPLNIISIALLCILLIPDININYLKPQLDNGIYPFLIGSPFVTTFFGICILMGMFAPICNKPKDIFIAKFTAVCLGAAVLGIIITLCISLFDLNLAKEMVAPSLMLARIVNVGSFIERTEVIWMIFSVGAGIMALTYLIWASSLGISQIVGMKTYQPLVFPLLLISMILTLTSFGSNLDVQNFTQYTFPIIGLFVETGLEIFLFIMAILLKKGTNS